jgi:hypothetical protein
MSADRTRRTTTLRDAAEAAFKAATTKPVEPAPKRRGRVGKIGSMRRLEGRQGCRPTACIATAARRQRERENEAAALRDEGKLDKVATADKND